MHNVHCDRSFVYCITFYVINFAKGYLTLNENRNYSFKIQIAIKLKRYYMLNTILYKMLSKYCCIANKHT